MQFRAFLSLCFLFCLGLFGCSVVVVPTDSDPDPQPEALHLEIREGVFPPEIAIGGQLKAIGLFELMNAEDVQICPTSVLLEKGGSTGEVVSVYASFSQTRGESPVLQEFPGRTLEVLIAGTEDDRCLAPGETRNLTIMGVLGEIAQDGGDVVRSGDLIRVNLTNVVAKAEEGDVKAVLLDGGAETDVLSGIQHVIRRARPMISEYPVDPVVVNGESEAYRFSISSDSIGGAAGFVAFALEASSAAIDGMPTRLRRYDEIQQKDIDMASEITVFADTPQAGMSTVLVRFDEIVLDPDPNKATILSLRWSSGSGTMKDQLAFAYRGVLDTTALECTDPTKVLSGVDSLPGIVWTDLPGQTNPCTAHGFTGDGLVSGIVR
jgi:hypothetical protein